MLAKRCFSKSHFCQQNIDFSFNVRLFALRGNIEN